MSDDIASRAARNLFFTGIRLAVSIGATLCTSAVIARELGPSNMGLYGYAMWIVGTLGILANIGLPSAITKYISEYLGNGDVDTAVNVGKRLLLTQVIVAGAVSVLMGCFMILKTPYRGLIGLASILLFMQALQQSLNATLAGVQKFNRLARVGVYVALVSLASIGVAALLGAGVTGMLCASLAAPLVAIWFYYRDIDNYLFRLTHGTTSSSARTTPNALNRVWKFSLTVSYILLLDSIVWQRSEVFFLKAYSTLAQIGFYTLAYSIVSKLSDVTSAFSSMLFPMYSESYGRKNFREIGFLFENAIKYVQMLIVPICFVGIALAKPLIRIVYGSAFLPVALPLEVLLASLTITSMGVVGSPLLYGTEKQSFMAKYGSAIAVLNIVLDLLLITRYAALGAAAANCTAQIAGVIGGTFFAVRRTHAKFPWRTIFTIYASGLIAVIPTAYIAAQAPFSVVWGAISIVTAAAIYVGLLLCSGELGKQEITLLKRTFLNQPSSTEALRPADSV